MITFVIMLGFPVSLVMAWALELTPQGVKKASGSDVSIYIFGAALAALSLYWFFAPQYEPPLQPATGTARSEEETVIPTGPTSP